MDNGHDVASRALILNSDVTAEEDLAQMYAYDYSW